jgi:CarboxypepD_reg-like domain
MGKLILITCILLFLQSNCIAQSVINGYITNEKTSKGVYASVVLKDEKGKIIVYSNSKNEGYFELKTTLYGIFNLQISSLSYEIQNKKIVIENNTTILNQNFILKHKITELKEVIVESRKSITEKKDTIIFDAKSFLQGNERVVEDLLKKIPGLNVQSDGTIKIGNQEVEKVMIDGDDFFEKGYKLVTKNMPVNPIDKVEIYQNYSNNKHLKGIENSEKVALNLTLKEDSKRIWFGNVFGGYGLVGDNNYEYKGNLMNFGKKSKHYFLTNSNNIGIDATGDINQLIRPFRYDEPASIGDNQSVKSLLSLNYDLPKLNTQRVNLNNDKLLSLNSIFSISKKLKLKTIGFFNKNEIDFLRNSFQQFANANTNFTRNEDFVGNKNKITGFGKVDLIYDISKTKTIEYTGKFNQSKEKNKSNLLFNSDSLFERLNNDNQVFDQKIVYTNKFKDKKVFLVTGRYINENTPQDYSVNKFYFNNLFSENANNTNQFSGSQMQFLGIEAHLLDKKDNGNLLEIKFGNQLRVDNLNSKFKFLENDTILSLPSNYQNNFTYSTNDLYMTAKYRFNFKKITFLNQFDAHQLINQLEKINLKSNQNPFFIIPKVGLDWKINENNKILTSYTYNTTNVDVLDIYSGYIQTGYNSFTKGIETFNQLNTSSAILNYTYGSWASKFFANTFILYSKNNDFYSTNSIISQNYTQSEKILIKDRNILSVVSNIDRYFKSLKSTFKINLGASETNSKNIVNNSNLREIKNLNLNYGFEVRSSFRGIFNYNFGSKSNFNQIETTIRNSYTDNMSFIDLSFIFSDKFNIQVQTERYFFGNLNKDINKYYFLDLEARYVIKQNKLTLFLTGNNLFNTKTFRNYSISDISFSQTEYKLQPRYVLLKMEYRF